MNRLGSHPAAGLSRSPSVRAIYINEETSKRAVNTHFHSPFKDGRPNKDYSNPSFISTHLLYPKEMLQKEQITVRQSFIPNDNDRKKEELYRKRINTEMNEQRAIRDRVERLIKGKESVQGSRIQTRGPKLIDAEQGLKNELNSLQNYRQLQNSQIKVKQEDAIPPYFEVCQTQLRSKERTAWLRCNSKRIDSESYVSSCKQVSGRVLHGANKRDDRHRRRICICKKTSHSLIRRRRSEESWRRTNPPS